MGPVSVPFERPKFKSFFFASFFFPKKKEGP